MESGDRWADKVAAFVVQALDLESDPSELAADVTSLKRDDHAGISAIELESSIGPAAFLVYHYVLPARGPDGRTGREQFDLDLATLRRASESGTPGPLPLAHATTSDEAYILATTPAVFQAMTGEVPVGSLDSAQRVEEPGAQLAIRQDAPGELLRHLKEADRAAARWLSAIDGEGHLAALMRGAGATEAEAALALFMVDPRSIPSLLRVLSGLAASSEASSTTPRNVGGTEPA